MCFITPASEIHYTIDQLHIYSEVYQVDNASEVLRLINQAAAGDLLVLDVDEVLITMKDAVLSPNVPDEINQIFYDTFYPFSDPEKIRILGEFLSQVGIEPVDPILNEGIADIQKRGVKAIGCTKMIPGPGACGIIPSMEDFRYHECQKRGIDFSGSFSMNELDLDYSPNEDNRVSQFKHGFLFVVKPYTKGDVLEKFLAKTGFRPNKIWFVDDREKNILDVKETCYKLDIPYVGVHYYDRKFNEWPNDLQLGLFQFNHFKNTGIWLDDEAAKLEFNFTK